MIAVDQKKRRGMGHDPEIIPLIEVDGIHRRLGHGVSVALEEVVHLVRDAEVIPQREIQVRLVGRDVFHGPSVEIGMEHASGSGALRMRIALYAEAERAAPGSAGMERILLACLMLGSSGAPVADAVKVAGIRLESFQRQLHQVVRRGLCRGGSARIGPGRGAGRLPVLGEHFGTLRSPDVNRDGVGGGTAQDDVLGLIRLRKCRREAKNDEDSHRIDCDMQPCPERSRSH